MRIERLNNDKIKVTLTASELVSLDIDVNRLSPDSKELHSFLFNIMETIKEETGFNPYSGQVVVEASPSSDGISILVSKLKSLPKALTREEIKNGFSIRAKTKRTANTAIFYFDNFDDLCLALKELKYEELLSGSLYRLNDTYCFAADNSPRLKRCVAIMREFSSGLSGYPLQLTYIKEHGTLIASGERLAEMAENIRSLS